jgi:vacuolar-type H+-ATPase subunit E/Vma4
MGLEEIIKNIELDTKSKAKLILDDAATQAEKIYLEADARAKEHIEQVNAKAENDAKQLVMRELSRANIESKGIYQNAVNDSINHSLETLHGSLDEYMKGADYTKLLGKLAALAVGELGAGSTLLLQKADVQKVKTTAIKDATIQEAKEKFVGGLRGFSKDKSMYVDYSLDKIIESLKEDIAVKLLDLIKE